MSKRGILIILAMVLAIIAVGAFSQLAPESPDSAVRFRGR